MKSALKEFRLAFSDHEEDHVFPFAPAAGDAGSSNAVTSAAKPVATIAQLANYLVNGFWQYNNTVAHHFGSATITYNISGLNANEQMLAQSALNAWHEVANLNFVQTSGAANITFTHNGTMTAYASSNYSNSGIISSAIVNISADWITNDGGAYDGKTGIDSYGYQTYIHEIGHALGLGHQGPYNGSASYSTGATYADDTWQYSVMSYFAQNNYGGSYRYVITPQMADIYAIQAIYGAATTRPGDTVYGFNSTAGSIFNFANYSQAPALTIYDSGGSDTLNCSGYSMAQTIDLHAGAFSSVGGLVNNIGIALNSMIEKAIGGSGNDTLIANDLSCTLTGGGGNDFLAGGAGIDWLVGGIGVDTMSGGGGADLFVFAFGDSSAASGQHDRINGFIAGVDRIDLSGIDAIAGTGAYDTFRFIGTSAFSGAAGELNYFYNSSLGVTVVQGDTNGDRIADFAIDLAGNITLGARDFIGAMAPSIVVEAFGNTQVTQNGNNFFLHTGASNLAIKFGGSNIVPNQFGAWIPIAAEQTAAGYQIAFKFGSADQYTIWSADSSGNYISNSITMTGSDSRLTSLESSFFQDLNGDGVISSGSAIEAFGQTQLTQNGNNFFLHTGASSLAIRFGGNNIVPNQFGAWTPIAAEQTAGGYQIAFKFGSADQYTIWTTDSSANYIANSVTVAGSDSRLTSLESSFSQDLNGDGVIGSAATVIEASGQTQLSQNGNNFFLHTGASDLAIKFGGNNIVPNQFGAWIPIAAEQTAGGYQIAFKFGSADQYTIWTTDSSANYITNSVTVAGSDSRLTSLESSFSQDLNGDGVIGSASTVIEAFGQTQLTQDGNNFFLHTVASNLAIKFGGSNVVPNQFGAWTPIAAEQTAGGYQIAWKFGSADQYTIWTTDSSGNYITNSVTVAGSDSRLTSLESGFYQDLNGSGAISSSAVLLSAEVLNPGNSPEADRKSDASLGDKFDFRPDWGTTIPGATAEGALRADAFSSLMTYYKQATALLNDALESQPHPSFGLANIHDERLGDHNIMSDMNLTLTDLHVGHFIIQ